MSGIFTVSLKVVTGQPLPQKQQTSELVKQLRSKDPNALGSKATTNELTFDMVYNSRADFVTDGKHQFFNEARAFVRDSGLVVRSNPITRIYFVKVV